MNKDVGTIVSLYKEICNGITYLKNTLKENHTFKTREAMINYNIQLYELIVVNDTILPIDGIIKSEIPSIPNSKTYTSCVLFNNIFNNGYSPITLSKNYSLRQFHKDLIDLVDFLNGIIKDGYFGIYDIFNDEKDIFTDIKHIRNKTYMLTQCINKYIDNSNVSEEDE